jgi:hypothetical protein
MLSSRNFILSHFTFKYMINLELIFVKSIRFISGLVFLHADIQLFQKYLLKVIVNFFPS